MQFHVGDQVQFVWAGETFKGTVVVADFGGALGFDTDTYDVKVAGRGWYKHLPAADLTLLQAAPPKDAIAQLLKEADAAKKLPKHDGQMGLDNQLQPGTYGFSTVSGSRYLVQVTTDSMQIQRQNADHILRRDDDWLQVYYLQAAPQTPGLMLLEALGEAPYTLRMTSKVVKIWREA